MGSLPIFENELLLQTPATKKQIGVLCLCETIRFHLTNRAALEAWAVAMIPYFHPLLNRAVDSCNYAFMMPPLNECEEGAHGSVLTIRYN